MSWIRRARDALGLDGGAGRTAFNNYMNEVASSSGDVPWSQVAGMHYVLQAGQLSTQDALQIMKPYLRSMHSSVAVKSFTVLDALAISSMGTERPLHAELSDRAWRDRLVVIIDHARDNRLRLAITQMLANWTELLRGTAWGAAYQMTLGQLEEKGIHLPSPSSYPAASAEFGNGFRKGHNYYSLFFANTSPSPYAGYAPSPQPDYPPGAWGSGPATPPMPPFSSVGDQRHHSAPPPLPLPPYSSFGHPHHPYDAHHPYNPHQPFSHQHTYPGHLPAPPPPMMHPGGSFPAQGREQDWGGGGAGAGHGSFNAPSGQHAWASSGNGSPAGATAHSPDANGHAPQRGGQYTDAGSTAPQRIGSGRFASTSDRNDEVNANEQVSAIRADSRRLVELSQKVSEAIAMKRSGGGGDEELAALVTRGWAAADQCQEGMKQIHAMLEAATEDEVLASLLDTHELLQSNLDQWQEVAALGLHEVDGPEGRKPASVPSSRPSTTRASNATPPARDTLAELLALDVPAAAHGGGAVPVPPVTLAAAAATPQAGEQRQHGRELAVSNGTGISVAPAEAGQGLPWEPFPVTQQRSPESPQDNAEARSMREKIAQLEASLLEAAGMHSAALADLHASHQRELMQTKAQALGRMKELMALVAEQEDDLAALQQENAALQQDKASLETRVQAGRQLEQRMISDAPSTSDGAHLALKYTLESEYRAQLDRATRAETSMRGEVQALRAQIRDLEVALQGKEAELAVALAEGCAASAKAASDLNVMHSELGAMQAAAQEALEYKRRAEAAEKVAASMKLELRKEALLRKQAHNQLRELKGNIRVLARVRPASVPGQQGASSAELALTVLDEYTLGLATDGHVRAGIGELDVVRKRYKFDACLGPDATQEEVYQEVRPLLQSALDGYNVCIFCYGQTGSGKTHTMLGSDSAPGIVPRAIQELYSIQAAASAQLLVSVLMMELYQDDLLDLLGDPTDETKLTMKTDEKGVVRVAGAVSRTATSAAELEAVLRDGLSRRQTAAACMNIDSSRSHLMLTLLLDYSNADTGTRTHSKIRFVDLAGSQRLERSGAVDWDAACAVNQSLSALGDVVAALTSGESFIPYRNHKLTELLRDSLGGNAKTLMIVNVSPLQPDAAETRNSLEYATRVKAVTNTASRSFESRELARLRGVIDQQAAELARLKGGQLNPL